MLSIEIKTIPHRDQRYSTIGDWAFASSDDWRIRVSQLHDWRMEVAIAIHELIESALCNYAGISQAAVDTFDQTYETEYGEPGDDPKCPYHHQHAIATAVERMVLAELGVNWKEYEDRINQCLTEDSTLFQKPATGPASPSG